MKLDNLRKLFVEELRDLYSAENQLVKALPKMAKGTSSEELKQALEDHLEQTQGRSSVWKKSSNSSMKRRKERPAKP